MDESVFQRLMLSTERFKQTAKLKVSDSSVKAGTRVRFTGSVSPLASGETIKLQRSENGVWKTKRTGKVSYSSTFVFSWTPTRYHRWRVKIEGTKYHTPTVSNAVKVRVK